MNSEQAEIKRAVVSEKGQVTIPKRLRARLGLAPGTVLEFRADRGRLIAEKADAREDPVLAVTGIVSLDAGAEAYLEELRGPIE